MFRFLNSKIKNMIKYAVINSFDDTGVMQRVTARALSKDQKSGLISPYGLIGIPPDGTLAILFNLQAQESNQVGIAFKSKNRIKGLPRGTTGIENYLTHDHIICSPDGSMQLNSATGAQIEITSTGDIKIISTNGVEIEAPDGVEINGDVEIDGNLDVTGTITGTPGVDLVNHVHIDPQGGITGPPQ